MDEKKNVVPFDVIPQINTGSFLTKEQAEQFKEAFNNLTVVVRCKDCKHWDAKKNECHNINSYIQYRPCFKDWFCADGERRRSGDADK